MGKKAKNCLGCGRDCYGESGYCYRCSTFGRNTMNNFNNTEQYDRAELPLDMDYDYESMYD